jgi:hypothetical protein
MQAQPHWRRLLLRTEETAAAYEAEIAARTNDSDCPLCHFEGVLQEYEHWVLMRNKFPYDRYFSKSDMLVTKRHAPEHEVTEAERQEYISLKENVLCQDYDSVMEHMPAQKSIPGHAHVHLVQFKRPDGLPR